MGFRRAFFDNLPAGVRLYCAQFHCEALAVIVKTHGKKYEVHRLLAMDEELLTFTYYDEKKSAKLPDRGGESIAWPAITVRYEDIESVELNPSKPGLGSAGLAFRDVGAPPATIPGDDAGGGL